MKKIYFLLLLVYLFSACSNEDIIKDDLALKSNLEQIDLDHEKGLSILFKSKSLLHSSPTKMVRYENIDIICKQLSNTLDQSRKIFREQGFTNEEISKEIKKQLNF